MKNEDIGDSSAYGEGKVEKIACDGVNGNQTCLNEAVPKGTKTHS